MKNKNYKLTILVAALAVGLSSCNKYLEQTPDLRIQVNSEEKVKQLLSSAYPKTEYLGFTELYSDNVEDKGVRSDYRYGDAGAPGQNWDMNYLWQDVENGASTTGSSDMYWNQTYLAIASANLALDYIEQHGNTPELLPFKGEALLARAYGHFMLVTLYAKVYSPSKSNDSPGVPYVTKAENKVNPNYDRETVAATYAKIEQDLTEGLPLINNNVYKVPKYHFTQEAANAFAARFYLFKGDYQKVIEHANKVLTSPDQTRTMLRPWNTSYSGVTATVLQKIFTESSQNANLLLGEANSSWARNIYIRYSLGPKVSNTVMAGPNISGGQYAYAPTDLIEPFYNTQKFRELFFETTIGSGFGQPYLMIPLLSTDELILNRAEAYIETGQRELALQDINTFMSTHIKNYSEGQHAVTLDKIASFYKIPAGGAALTKEQLITALLDVKRPAFIAEGLRWFDMIRRGLTVRHNQLDVNGNETFIELKPDDLRRVFQLPQAATKAGIPLNPR